MLSILTKAQTPGCLYGNELYTTLAPGGKYGNNSSYGAKITPSADQCFYTTNPSPNACTICVYGVNPAGNCRSGLAPVAYSGLEASYALVSCPIDDYIPFLTILISGMGFFYLRKRMTGFCHA
ncbi:hypothetical protein EZ428_17820 [Pedobacter frigiditerrae]|uniref:Uncharacterized protein n=2 Tax=Pedobacter frigiditerrae TaxID=2530452 RepID=A0A4R0MNV7_9SPHI|nr:hypothetical protein EZ428_17820 [Pedobacter frigiditerrae]